MTDLLARISELNDEVERLTELSVTKVCLGSVGVDENGCSIDVMAESPEDVNRLLDCIHDNFNGEDSDPVPGFLRDLLEERDLDAKDT